MHIFGSKHNAVNRVLNKNILLHKEKKYFPKK